MEPTQTNDPVILSCEETQAICLHCVWTELVSKEKTMVLHQSSLHINLKEGKWDIPKMYSVWISAGSLTE